MNDALDTLLSAATEELPRADKYNKGEKFLEDVATFAQDWTSQSHPTKEAEVSESVIHTGETDSSDDEDNRYFESRKYDSFGSAIKQVLSTSSPTAGGTLARDESTWQTKVKQLFVLPAKAQPKSDVYADPIFGIRIVNPSVSGALLQERMDGRLAVPMATLKEHIKKVTGDTDWVIAGAVVHKSAPKTSQKGSAYTIWTLSDLHRDLKTVALFLFGNAFKQLWKTGLGTVVGILNPFIFDKNSNTRDEAALSIDNPQKVMVLGQSKDFGTCKSTRKNGERCTAFVNTNTCEFCLYHVKKEYQKCTKRSELQSNFSGRGLTALRNKVLGKNEVFYAGKSYVAVPAGKNKKLAAKDDRRLKALGNVTVNAEKTTRVNNLSKRKAAAHLELSANQRAKDFDLLKKLTGNSSNREDAPFNASPSDGVTLEESKRAAVNVISKLKAAETENSKNENPEATTANSSEKNEENKDDVSSSKKKAANLVVPSLSRSTGDGVVDLSAPVTRKLVNRAKLNALNWVKRNGPIKKVDPMSTRGTRGKKRPLSSRDDPDVDDDGARQVDVKQQKIEQNEFLSDRFKKMMAISSRHTDLLQRHDDEQQEKYFDKLEKKERLEEKMLSTYKLQCKAVRCLKCKYTSFSAADLCKAEKHPLKVYDAFKRFFMCGDCKNRTVTLGVVPTVPCGKCGGGKWERAPMLREKQIGAVHHLSIRGGEQASLNSNLSNANLDLLVPDVCKKFNEIGSNLLSRRFIQLEKRHSTVIKRVKALLPRRESERRAHPLARHCDILSAVETRISMLNMTFMKYIESNLCCFIPGKVIDEIERILRVVESEGPPPRTHELLQELRDISSMAMEHFDEHILPTLKMQIRKSPMMPLLPSTSKSSKLVLVQYAIVDEVRKVRKQYKAQKVQLNIVTSNLERFLRKIKRQNLRLKAQSIKIKEQERKIQEQSVKIQEHESTIADIKKHMDEWEQKFSDLTSEVRARDDFMSSKTPAKQASSFTQATPKFHLQNIKPRKAQVLSKSFVPIQIDLDRKRKSNLGMEIPSKLPRCADVVTAQQKCSRKFVENVDELLNSLTNNAIANCDFKDPCDEKNALKRNNEFTSFISSSLETILKNPISSIKSRKRKMTEEIDLK